MADEIPDNFGFDKTARREAEERAALRPAEQVRLEPAFPWPAIGYPAEIFGAIHSQALIEED